jgi:hypothetical protein
MRIPGALALAAILAAATGAHAQAFVGAGGGLSLVGEPRSDASHLGASLHLRAGWSLGPATALMLEANMNGFDSSAPDSTLRDFGPADGPYYEHFTRTLQTDWLLASVQLGNPGSFYVRPGVGIARRAYVTTEYIASDVIVQATKRETAPALGLAVGRRIDIPGFPLNVEATAGWSGHEDSTNPRWTTGLQVVRVIQF